MPSCASGHIVEHKEGRLVLGKWGNDLRRLGGEDTCNTLAQAASVAEVDAHLLMNRKASHLRAQLERISTFIFSVTA